MTGSRTSVEKMAQAADFADHVEDGLEVARTVSRIDDLADIARGGIDARDAVDIGRNMAENEVRDGARDELFDVVEDEIEDQDLGRMRRKGRDAVRKGVRR